jgi:hypothetical protein
MVSFGFVIFVDDEIVNEEVQLFLRLSWNTPPDGCGPFVTRKPGKGAL